MRRSTTSASTCASKGYRRQIATTPLPAATRASNEGRGASGGHGAAWRPRLGRPEGPRPAGRDPDRARAASGQAQHLHREGRIRRSIERSQEIVQGETATVELQLSALPVVPPVLEPEPEPLGEPPRPRLRNAAIGTAASTLATAAVALGLSLRARTLNDEYEQAAAEYRMTGDCGRPPARRRSRRQNRPLQPRRGCVLGHDHRLGRERHRAVRRAPQEAEA